MTSTLALVRINGKKSVQITCDRLPLPPAATARSVTIGRELDCELRIDSIEVSRRHVRLDYIEGQWHATDLESTNGLSINGKRLEPLKLYPLKIGDKLSFGPLSRSKLDFQLMDISGSPKRKISDVESVASLNKKRRFHHEVAAKKFHNEWKNLFDLELSCSICHELFVSAVSLNCAHTFCESCIDQWKGYRKNQDSEDESSQDEPDMNCCPICREPIVSQNRVRALDNVIDYILKNWTPSLLEPRRRLIRERQSAAN